LNAGKEAAVEKRWSARRKRDGLAVVYERDFISLSSPEVQPEGTSTDCNDDGQEQEGRIDGREEQQSTV
jgi:hypothetical protein